jgi:5-methylcytosine-specific restriction protein B
MRLDSWPAPEIIWCDRAAEKVVFPGHVGASAVTDWLILCTVSPNRRWSWAQYMIEDRQQFAAEFIPYLREFMERAKADKPELAQVQIPSDLQAAANRLGIIFKTSFGMGTPTVIPWLACFLAGQTAGKDGVYPVLLFRRDTKTLSVCYGVSATAKPAEGHWPRKWPPNLVAGLDRFGHQKYQESFEVRLFSEGESGNLGAITDLFLRVIEDYLQVPRDDIQRITPFPATIVDLEALALNGQKDIEAAGLILQAGLLVRFASALLTKRFIIVTGLSGSGKTKLAHAFAEWISESEKQYRVVAVGADWTTNENLLGYQDALRPETYRKPTNGALDLMVRARDDAVRPYFLILDEMNLSHVERYFADMLSAIESDEPIALHSAAENLPGGDGDTVCVPARLALPKNLFIIGTVNVDETTYMFSPKVLDRANVIEFRATADQIGMFLDDPQPIRMDALSHKGAQFGAGFVGAASGAGPKLAELPASIHPDGSQCTVELKERLVEVFKALAPIGAEFGFRTAFEISRFVVFHAMLTGTGWKFSTALDAQVLQKLLPKLHGSERRLGPVLKALEEFCTMHGCPASLEKIGRMQDRLKDGFTSFAEA